MQNFWRLGLWAFTALFLGPLASAGEPIVPGTGVEIQQVGDDFEGERWQFFPNHPKSSRNIDDRERPPLAQSANKRWLEGPHRGTPDLVKRVPTPNGGLAASDYSLLIQTQRSGIPNRPTNEPQQDDLMITVRRRLGHSLSPSMNPNCVVRVYVPPFEEWEDRTGASFGVRIDCWGKRPGERKQEQYWPGIFFNFRSATHPRIREDSAYLSVRGDQRGRDLRGPELRPGWWTVGMSVSADGQCHFYAREGVDDLTEEDRLGSYFCYGFHADRFDLVFFNVVSFDNGRTVSTPWIVDDPKVYYTPQMASRTPTGHTTGQTQHRRVNHQIRR